ncbi:hypothetical protein DFH27DRAFT_201840 [Peziza echinospora]|nr:hypothetical protein DFH27DRAFT_201840 [Peziza echinospora]
MPPTVHLHTPPSSRSDLAHASGRGSSAAAHRGPSPTPVLRFDDILAHPQLTLRHHHLAALEQPPPPHPPSFGDGTVGCEQSTTFGLILLAIALAVFHASLSSADALSPPNHLWPFCGPSQFLNPRPLHPSIPSRYGTPEPYYQACTAVPETKQKVSLDLQGTHDCILVAGKNLTDTTTPRQPNSKSPIDAG